MCAALNTTKSTPILASRLGDRWRTSEERLEAIQAVRATPDFEPLAASFKRIQNILKQSHFEGAGRTIDPELIEHGPESDLHAAFVATRLEVMTKSYREALGIDCGAASQSGFVF